MPYKDYFSNEYWQISVDPPYWNGMPTAEEMRKYLRTAGYRAKANTTLDELRRLTSIKVHELAGYRLHRPVLLCSG
jgi:hypothetical protein